MAALQVGARAPPPQDQVLRNQTVGSTWIAAASGPRLATSNAHQDIVGAGLGVLH